MISPLYYNKKTAVRKLFGNSQHYAPKSKTIVLRTYPYIIEDGDTLYSLAIQIFGEDNEYLWTIISDSNPHRHPDDWKTGDTILLPEQVIHDKLELF